MSFSYRDRPSLSDRLRGRTGDQLLEDLEKEIEEDRKMFFDRGPAWNATPRSGSFSRAFPFDDSPRRQDIRSHLEDLANRHPEFADHLRCPPWGGEVGAHSSSRWGDWKQPSAESHRDEDSHSQASNSSTGSDGPSGSEKQGGLSHHGLRNTVDIGQQQYTSEQPKGSRGQRSMSAPPPDNRGQNSEQAPPRYVTRLNITPSTNVDNVQNDQGKPPVAPKQQSTPQQPQQPASPKQSFSGNVRHIPIFVEGRDEPVLPKNIDPSYTPKPPHFQHSSPQPPPHSFGRPVFDTHHQFESQPPPQTPPQNRKFSQQQAKAQQAQPPPPPPPMPQHVPLKQQSPANDPISRVMTVQKDVDDLAVKVEQFSGTSRKDKEYIYLDEMLTRNLLKLDDIETEGKENVRQARKEAIKSIQKCINVLEGKVPLPEELESAESVVCTEEPTVCTEAPEVPVSQGESDAINQASEDKMQEKTMEVESCEPIVEHSSNDGVDRSDNMEVECSNVLAESEEAKMMEVESVQETETAVENSVKDMESVKEPVMVESVGIRPMEVEGKQPETEQTPEDGSSVLQTEKVEVKEAVQIEATNEDDTFASEKTENSPKSGTLEEAGLVKLLTEAPLDKVDITPSKPVQEIVSALEVKADGICAKGSESPKLKSKGTKTKKEGVKTRKGKAGKSAERKSFSDNKVDAAAVSSEPEKEHLKPKASDVAVNVGQESDVGNDANQVTKTVASA